MGDHICFTCSHEIRQDYNETWVHEDESMDAGCPCKADETPCEPW